MKPSPREFRPARRATSGSRRQSLAWVLVLAVALLVAIGAIGSVGGVTGDAGPAANAAESGPVDGTETGPANATTNDDTRAGDERATDTTFELSGLEDKIIVARATSIALAWGNPSSATVSVRVKNTGDERASTWVDVRVPVGPNASQVVPSERERVTLDAGESTTVTLQPKTLVGRQPGNYTIRVSANGTVAESTLAVTYPRLTDFALGTIDDATIDPGQTTTVSVPVRNTGRPPDAHPTSPRSQGRANLSLWIDGTLVDAETVWLDVDESTTVSLSIPASALSPGDNRVVVRSRAESLSAVHYEVRSTVTLAQETTTGEDGAGLGVLAMVLAGIFGLLVAVGVGVRRRS